MSEVKFRAFDMSEIKMYHNVGIIGTLIILEHEQNGYDFCEVDLTLYDQLDDKYHLMRYTGWKDKNGNEIYEGDIFQADRYPVCKQDGYVGVVEYGDGAFWGTKRVKEDSDVSGDADGNYELLNEFVEDDIEVIGNIHENRYLLRNTTK